MNISETCKDCGKDIDAPKDRFGCQLCFEYRMVNPTRCYECVWWHKINFHGADPPPGFAKPTPPATS